MVQVQTPGGKNSTADLLDFESLLPQKEQKKLERVRDFLEAEVIQDCTTWWNNAEFPHHLIPKIADAHVMSMVKHQGYSYLLAGLMHAEITRYDASIGTFLGVHDALYVGTLELLASQEQQEQWLPDAYNLTKVGAFGLTEPDAGSDIAGGSTTTAQKAADGWILNGSKRWIGNATFSDYVIIFAADVEDGALKGFLVDTSSLGYSTTKIENKISLRTVQNADITLENVLVPHDYKLANANSFKDTNKVLKNTRVGVAWQAVGLQLAAYDVALAYAKERTQFGKPIASFQLIQDQLVSILGNVQASAGMLAQLAHLQQQGRLTDAQSALAKRFTAQKMRESVSVARAILGGNGIVTDHHAAKIFADAEAIYTYEGTHEVNTLVVGRAITGISAII